VSKISGFFVIAFCQMCSEMELICMTQIVNVGTLVFLSFDRLEMRVSFNLILVSVEGTYLCSNSI